MQIEGGLIRGGERAVERVGQHRLALGAVLGSPDLRGLRAAELVEVCHLHHLSF